MEQAKKLPPISEANFPILVIDDSSDILDLARAYFEKTPFPFYALSQPEEAVRIIRAHGIKLVFLDLHMGKTYGMDVLKKIKAEKDCADIPVVMLTGDGKKQQVVSAIQEGCEDYILKPFRENIVQRAYEMIARRYPELIPPPGDNMLRQYRKGEWIMREEDREPVLVQLRSGKVATYRSKNGRDVLTGHLQKGEWSGAFSVMLGFPQSESLLAETDTTVVYLSFPRESGIAALSPAILNESVASLWRRYRLYEDEAVSGLYQAHVRRTMNSDEPHAEARIRELSRFMNIIHLVDKGGAGRATSIAAHLRQLSGVTFLNVDGILRRLTELGYLTITAERMEVSASFEAFRTYLEDCVEKRFFYTASAECFAVFDLLLRLRSLGKDTGQRCIPIALVNPADAPSITRMIQELARFGIISYEGNERKLIHYSTEDVMGFRQYQKALAALMET